MIELDENFQAFIKYRLEQSEEAVYDSELLLNAKRYRASVNRLYYACFYAASAMLLTKRMQFSKHSAVIAYFDKSFIKSGILPKEYSRTIHEAFNERQEDEYKPFAEPDPEYIRALYWHETG
jgi:uncharacterized protein (UPF0332 family)